MSKVFDTVTYARALHQAGMPSKQALAIAEATRDNVMSDLVTKADMEKYELRIVIKLGGIIAAGIGLLAVLMKLPA